MSKSVQAKFQPVLLPSMAPWERYFEEQPASSNTHPTRIKALVRKFMSDDLRLFLPARRVTNVRVYLLAFVIGITRFRLLRDILRRAYQRTRGQVIATRPGSPSLEEMWDINETIAELPRALLQVVQLRHWVRLTVDEVAELLGLKRSTVLNRMKRAAVLLRPKLSTSNALFVLPTLAVPETDLPALTLKDPGRLPQ